MDNRLRDLRVNHHVDARDMVEEVRKLYPKYDRTLQTKCERGDEYGVVLRDDAMKALCEKFAPDEPKRPRMSDHHRLTCRIYGRLAENAFQALKKYIQADGFKSVQEWLSYIVYQYITEKDYQIKL